MYHSDIDALWARNEALERELADTREALASRAPSSELTTLARRGRETRVWWLREIERSKRQEEESKRREAARWAARELREARASTWRALSRVGWLAHPAVPLVVALLSLMLPLTLMGLIIAGLISPWFFAKLFVVGVSIHLLARLWVRIARHRVAGWLAGLPFLVRGWMEQLMSREHAIPVIEVRFRDDAPNREWLAELMHGCAATKDVSCRSALQVAAESLECEGHTVRVSLDQVQHAVHRRRAFYMWTRILLDEVFVKLNAGHPIVEVAVTSA